MDAGKMNHPTPPQLIVCMDPHPTNTKDLLGLVIDGPCNLSIATNPCGRFTVPTRSQRHYVEVKKDQSQMVNL